MICWHFCPLQPFMMKIFKQKLKNLLQRSLSIKFWLSHRGPLNDELVPPGSRAAEGGPRTASHSYKDCDLTFLVCDIQLFGGNPRSHILANKKLTMRLRNMQNYKIGIGKILNDLSQVFNFQNIFILKSQIPVSQKFPLYFSLGFKKLHL